MSRICFHCQKPLLSYQTKYCSFKCQKDQQYDEAIDKWLSGVIEGIRPDGSFRWPVRRYILERDGYKCTKCGWCEKNPITGKSPLEIDHEDGNFRNNDPKNLRTLCPNCHSLTPFWKSLNKGRGRKKSIAARDLGVREDLYPFCTRLVPLIAFDSLRADHF